MTTAAATSGAQPEKAKELGEAKKHGAGVAEWDGVQPTATWLQVHMQFMFLSLFTFFFCLFFFSLPSIRPSAHPSAASLFRSVAFSFCGGKSSRADHVHLLGFSPASIELLFRTRSSHLLYFPSSVFFSFYMCLVVGALVHK